jgi:hypothetical protein
MKRLVLAVVVVVLLLVMVAPEIAKTYPQEFGWWRSFTSGTLGTKLGRDLGSLRGLISDSEQLRGSAPGAEGQPGKIPPGAPGGAPAASANQRRELTDWEKARPRAGKGPVGKSETDNNTPSVVVIRSKPYAVPALEVARQPRLDTLSAHTVVISGDLSDPGGDSVADAARRYRGKTQPQPGQAPAR